MSENNNIGKNIKNLAEKYGISEEEVKKIIIKTFTEYYCIGENSKALLKFDFGKGEKTFSIYRIYNKEDLENNNQLKDRLISNENGEYLLPIDLKNFSSSEMEKILTKNNKRFNNRVVNHSSYKVNYLVKGIIVKEAPDRENYIIELEDKVFGVCRKEEFPGMDIRFGQTWCSFVVKDLNDERSNSMLLTRWNDIFVRRVMESNVPEIKKGEIVIKAILRKPGTFSKILVEGTRNNYNNNDPSGACIGRNGDRIKAVSKLMNEQVEIAAWSDDEKQLLLNLFSPVKVASIMEEGKEGNLKILIPKEKAPLLLSRSSEKLKIISDYLGKKIKIEILEEIKGKKDTLIIWNGNINLKV